MKSNIKTEIEKLQKKIKDKNIKLDTLSTFNTELKRQIEYEDDSNFVIIILNNQITCREGLLDEQSFDKAVSALMPKILTKREQIIREGFAYSVSKTSQKVNNMNTGNLPTLIFKNFKKYLLKYCSVEIQKLVDEIEDLNKKIKEENSIPILEINDNNSDLTFDL